MRRLGSLVVVSLLVVSSLCMGEETTFSGCKLVDAKGKQVEARLIFSDTSKDVIIRVSDRDLITIPYGNIDKLSYEYTKKHRITQGAIVMVASLGAGAVVMLTKSKSHWLYIDYHDHDAARTAVLRMDKTEYKKILESARIHTGREVTMAGETGKSSS